MKRKDVEKLLKKEVNATTDRDSLSEIKNKLGIESDRVYVQQDGSVAVTRRRGIIATIIAVFAVVVISAVMTMAFRPRSGATLPSLSVPVFTSKTDIYALAGISTGELLVEMSGAATSGAALASSRGEGNGYGQEASSELSQEVDGYMRLVNTLLSAAAVTPVFEELKGGEYRYRSVTTVVDAAGESVTYTMLYNEEEITNGRDRHDDEEERETRIDGVMLIGGDEFPFEGARETEEEDGESEMELELIAYLDSGDSGTFVKFKQEIENDEQSYAYEIYERGERIDEFELEIERESDETEISLEKNGVKYQLKEQKRDDYNVITVEYEHGGKRYKLVAVPQSDGRYKYYYND